MKVSQFKTARDSAPMRYSLTISQALDRISNGSVKKHILELRAETSKSKRDELKKELTAVTFGGEFIKRSKKDLKESSGYMILDFDKLEDCHEFKENLKINEYIYSAWISPSGDGVKALVKIPKVLDNEQYASYYVAFVDALNEPSIDKSGKDISRLCFESYDPELWINEHSLIWIEFEPLELEQPVYHHDEVTVPLTDEDEIVNRLLKWFEKQYKPTERNNSINKLAFSFNLFGISRQRAESICLKYEQKDFKSSEIIATVRSAYSKTNLFNTKSFQDDKKKDRLVNFSRGKSLQEIKAKFPEVSENIIEDIKQKANDVVFWQYSDKGKISIVPSYFRDYLHENGINKILFVDNKNVVAFIRREGKFVEEYSSEMIKDFVLSDMDKKDNIDVWNELAGKTKYFEDKFLSMVDSKKVDVDKDGVDYSLFYYLNCVVKVKVDSIEILDYDSLKDCVWKNQVIQRDYVKSDHHESDFRSFIWFACGQNKSNYETFKSVIGRLLHSYKTMSGNVAIIANDENLSDEPNGGSGKSLLFQAVNQLRKVSEIDGKSFNFKERFNYQTVSIDTQVLVFDDIEKNFDFERLFSVITGGITLEYKSQNATKLKVTDSPHIYITTNYAIKGNGGSFDRRKFEIEFSSYFGSHRTPEDVFQKRFFDEWNTDEWAKFDNFMINCLQFYLANGLVKQDHKTLAEKKFKTETNSAWYEFVNKHISFKCDERYYKSEVKSKFFELNDHFKDLSTNSITKWVNSYALLKHWNITHSKDNRGMYFIFDSGTKKELIDEEGKIDLSGIDLN